MPAPQTVFPPARGFTYRRTVRRISYQALLALRRFAGLNHRLEAGSPCDQTHFHLLMTTVSR
jgi:hypothetical protein